MCLSRTVEVVPVVVGPVEEAPGVVVGAMHVAVVLSGGRQCSVSTYP